LSGVRATVVADLRPQLCSGFSLSLYCGHFANILCANKQLSSAPLPLQFIFSGLFWSHPADVVLRTAPLAELILANNWRSVFFLLITVLQQSRNVWNIYPDIPLLRFVA
jgi:hypothetical protein